MLSGVMHQDVIVIGGGIVGTATAAHLVSTGRSTLLLERSTIGAGASGRNSGVVQHPFDPVMIELYRETLGLYRGLIARTDGAFQLGERAAGMLMVSTDPAVARTLADDVAAAMPDIESAYLGPGEVTALEPAFAEDVAACRLDLGFPVEPIGATRAYALAAERLGASLREGVEARPIIRHGRVHGVETRGPDGADGVRIAAETVIVAAGPWTPAIVDPSGAWRPIRPLWGAVVDAVLDAPPGHAAEEVWTGVEPNAEHPDHAFSLVTAGGRSSIGSCFVADEPDPAAVTPVLLERARRFIPGIADARIGGTRVCARPLSLDERPLVGAVPGVEGLYVAAGHGPWGISTGPAAATLLTDLVEGRRDASPAALDPARFGAIPGLD
jgi:glycine/D-amino acid oxidase-like deaminating enzyme